MNSTYNITLGNTFLGHATAPTLVVEDTNSPDYFLNRAVMIASGDCHATLATQLEVLKHNLEALDKKEVREALDETISTLLYLQDHYSLTKKS